MKKYTRERTVRLQHTDAAGILFFANLIVLCHEVYEEFMTDIGFGFDRIIRNGEFRIPIVHVEADYRLSLRAGDRAIIDMHVSRIGTTSYVLDYSISTPGGEPVGTCCSIHVTIDARENKKMPLPTELRNALHNYLHES